MSLNVGRMVSALRSMTVPELQQKYAAVHGEPTGSHHKDQLIRRIAWRMQALAEGDLPERLRHIRERASEIANDADLRTRGPAPGTSTATKASGRATTTHIDVPTDARLPMPGTLLTREYRGRIIQVRVLPNGFDYECQVYRSLSAVATAVTGAHWNGFLFFGLQSPRKDSKR